MFADLVDQFPDSTGPVGVTVPGVVRNGVVHSAANIDKSWIGTDADALFTGSTGARCTWSTTLTRPGWPRSGTARPAGSGGLVIMTTLGTGIGSALLYDGVLVPNSELGHLEIERPRRGEVGREQRARERGPVLAGVGGPADDVLPDAREAVLPELFVVGGGVSKKSDEFLPLLGIRHRDRARARCATRPAIVGRRALRLRGRALSLSTAPCR